jgi:broad specificity phosphatase PhoE
MKKIYLIRHGETDYFKTKNEPNSHLKQDNNTPLNKNGMKNAIITGRYLKFRQDNDPKNKIDMIITSPLLRAKQTANLIAKELNFNESEIISEEKITDIKLTEKYKNMTVEEFQKKSEDNKETEIKDYYNFYKIKDEITTAIELNDFIIKHESNESIKIFENIHSMGERVNNFIEGIKNINKNNIVVVTHGKIISWLIKLMSNIVGNEFIKGETVNNNSFCAITLYLQQDDNFVLHTINSNNHLKQ